MATRINNVSSAVRTISHWNNQVIIIHMLDISSAVSHARETENGLPHLSEIVYRRFKLIVLLDIE